MEYSDLIKILKSGNLNLKVSNTSNPYFFISITNENRSIIKEISNATNIQQSLEITEDDLRDNTLKIRFGFYYGKNNSKKSATIKPMVYQDGDGTYQPYHHTALTIPLTSPLYEGDKICYVKPGDKYVNADGDTVVADRVLYGCYRENATEVFDGSEDEAWDLETNNRYRIALNNSSYKYTENTAKCNFFKYNTNVYIDYGNEIGFIVSTIVFYCRFDSASEINSVSNLKAWLSNNPLTVVYKLATPYFEPFPDQSIFYTLRTDDTLSYVYSSDPIEPNVTVEVAKNSTGGLLLESYAQAQKNAISEANSQSRISAIEQQLVNQATTPTE